MQVKEQMCRKLAKDQQKVLLDYVERFVIVEMLDESHRVVSRRFFSFIFFLFLLLLLLLLLLFFFFYFIIFIRKNEI